MIKLILMMILTTSLSAQTVDYSQPLNQNEEYLKLKEKEKDLLKGLEELDGKSLRKIHDKQEKVDIYIKSMQKYCSEKFAFRRFKSKMRRKLRANKKDCLEKIKNYQKSQIETFHALNLKHLDHIQEKQKETLELIKEDSIKQLESNYSNFL